jgi:large subunit ribosomal protein L29
MKENAERARGLDNSELQKQIRDTAEQVFRLRFQMSMGQMEGLKKLRSAKKERARMLTVLREREIGAAPAAAPAPAKKPAKPGRAQANAKPVAAKPAAQAPAAKAPAAKKKPAAAKAAAAKKHKAKPAAPKSAAKKKTAPAKKSAK